LLKISFFINGSCGILSLYYKLVILSYFNQQTLKTKSRPTLMYRQKLVQNGFRVQGMFFAYVFIYVEA